MSVTIFLVYFLIFVLKKILNNNNTKCVRSLYRRNLARKYQWRKLKKLIYLRNGFFKTCFRRSNYTIN